ncbi:hypothetical protein GYD59_004708 [Salmonella enterica]|nr:hypothetical protein [Salmonella enterica subsp. enterica serovar Oranienburg]EEH2569847.1 hypothetical protein [Salmonella enterica]
MKFVYKHHSDCEKNNHWERCKKDHAPFIEISKVNRDYMNIFYDITDYNIDLEKISDDVKKIHSSYIDFFIISDAIVTDGYEQCYFFNLIVKQEHAEFFAAQLYDYLLNKLH